MPELPEVETIRRGLAHLAGRRIRDALVRWPRSFNGAGAAASQLSGESITALERRGKHLLLRLSSGKTIGLHLRMSGRLRMEAAGQQPLPHERIRLIFDDGSALVFIDPRKFGRMTVLEPEELRALDAALGIEPLGEAFSSRALEQALHGTRRPVKAALLDQARVAGIGNIYADESLHAARIHPARSAARLTPSELERLARAIQGILAAAVSFQGTTFQMYRDATGKKGRFVSRLKVYGRAGGPCRTCGTTLLSARLAQRTTTWCPECQPQQPSPARKTRPKALRRSRTPMGAAARRARG